VIQHDLVQVHDPVWVHDQAEQPQIERATIKMQDRCPRRVWHRVSGWLLVASAGRVGRIT
jgi:hypothetical protein